MKTSDFDYDLPEEFIAQTPVEPRDASRLMVVDRRTENLTHTVFRRLGDFLNPGDLLVINQTRVLPARLYARKIPSGGKVEILLLHREDSTTWEALVGGKGLGVGRAVQVVGGPRGEVAAVLDGARRLVQFESPLEGVLEQIGHVPLPPYIHTRLENPERYQTVYARQPGSAAAPTAGLHFTPELIESLQVKGIRLANVTLHVGLDTFAPVTEAEPEEHKIHTEWCQVSPETAEAVNQTKESGGRVIAVGTTSVRTLESAARAAAQGAAAQGAATNGATIAAFEGPTDLFILPGFRFRAVDAMITNFHLPRSTLIMLVSAFASRELIARAYEEAKASGYRFYSFGDAMLIV